MTEKAPEIPWHEILRSPSEEVDYTILIGGSSRRQPSPGKSQDSLWALKSAIQRFPVFYRLVVLLFSPVFIPGNAYRRIRRHVPDGWILNLGSGFEPRRKQFINLDARELPNVDIVGNAERLPFKDSTLDGAVSVSLFEHVRKPSQAISEVHRVLKPGAYVLTVAPFMQPFHASPFDYQRYTLPGLEELHNDFHVVESGVWSGPVSGFLWVLQEFFSVAFSFGSERMRSLVVMLVLAVSWPIKFLDLVFRGFGPSKYVASSFFVVAKKPV